MRNILMLVTTAALAACGGSGTPAGDRPDGLDIPVGEDLLAPDAEGPGDEADPGADEGDAVQDLAGDAAIDLPPDDLPLDPGPEPDEDADAPEEVDDIPDVCDSPACMPCPDDGLPCTDTVKNENGDCVTTIQKSFCLIGGKCYFTLEPSPDSQCLFCNPLVDQGKFLPNSGLPCDDGDLCTSGDVCGKDGKCASGPPTNCDDGNVCTIDKCIKGMVGCVHEPFTSSCDDKNKCTYQDHCEKGKCVGVKLPCDDANACTDDSCQPQVGCKFLPTAKPCDDSNACTSGDTCDKGKCVGQPLDCDDKNPCTKDSCVSAAGGCIHENLFGACDDGDACTINDHCTADHLCVGYAKECDDVNKCTNDSCDPAVGCVFAPNDNLCDDGDPCTDMDKCSEGKCTGTPKDCEEGNLCTIDTCHPVYGCQHTQNLGPCNDKNACTTGDTCASGACVGTPADCDDHNVCTSDSCDPAKGCVHTPQEGTCDDGNPCTEGKHCEGGKCVSVPKDCTDNDPCTIDKCGPGGLCVHEQTWGACDDGDACTSGDECVTGECKGYPSTCNDDNACTVDSCDPVWGCVYKPDPLAQTCDDHSVCTTGDHCQGGKCVGTQIVCDDSNPCTNNLCNPAAGCYYEPFAGPCDDGESCTLGDTCTGGKCLGKSLLGDPAHNSGTMTFGVSGNPGQGIDVDQNAATCAPKGSCVQGIDNAFAKIAWLFNPELTKAVTEGKYAMLLGHDNPDMSGQPYKVNFLYGTKVEPAECDATKEMCNFRIFPSELSGACAPKWVFDNAVLDGTQFSAGGPGYQVPVYLIFGELRIPVTLKWSRIMATITIDGDQMAGGTGVLGGAVNRQELLNAVAAVPADQFPPPYTKEIVQQYLDMYVAADIDMDNDGTKEATSMGLPFTLVVGHILGAVK